MPLSALIVFAIGYFVAFLIGLAWHSMPPAVKWATGAILTVIYLLDAMKRE